MFRVHMAQRVWNSILLMFRVQSVQTSMFEVFGFHMVWYIKGPKFNVQMVNVQYPKVQCKVFVCSSQLHG